MSSLGVHDVTSSGALFPGYSLDLSDPGMVGIEVPEGRERAARLFPAFCITMASAQRRGGLILVEARKQGGVDLTPDGGQAGDDVVGFTVRPSTLGAWTLHLWTVLFVLNSEASDLLRAYIDGAIDARRLACLLSLLFLALMGRMTRPMAAIPSEPDPLALPRIRAPGTDAGLFAPLC